MIWRFRNEMQIYEKVCRKSESFLLFSYENIITEGANMRPIEACALK